MTPAHTYEHGRVTVSIPRELLAKPRQRTKHGYEPIPRPVRTRLATLPDGTEYVIAYGRRYVVEPLDAASRGEDGARYLAVRALDKRQHRTDPHHRRT